MSVPLVDAPKFVKYYGSPDTPAERQDFPKEVGQQFLIWLATKLVEKTIILEKDGSLPVWIENKSDIRDFLILIASGVLFNPEDHKNKEGKTNLLADGGNDRVVVFAANEPIVQGRSPYEHKYKFTFTWPSGATSSRYDFSGSVLILPSK